MEKKRVLMVHNYYQIGGGEHTVFENEVNMLRENGHEVFTYTRNNDELKTSKVKLLLSPFSTIWSFKTYFEVKKLIKQNKIDIVHCHNTFPLVSPSVYYAARTLKIPVIQTIHNFRFLCPSGVFYCKDHICEECKRKNSFMPALKNKCYRNSKIQTAIVVSMLKFHRLIGTYKKISYIFLTEFNKSKFDKLLNIKQENLYVKPNFVCEPELPEKTEKNIKQFVFAGRLEKNKGIDFLIDVWAKMPNDYKLHIYGDGEYKQKVEQAAKEYKNINFYGFKSHKDIFDDLSTSTALIFPSNLYETFGMSVAEAFSLTIPVVTTNVGNPGSIVMNANAGTLYSCNDDEQFIKAINDVIENNALYSSNAKKFFDDNLTMKINYAKLSDIYEKASHIM